MNASKVQADCLDAEPGRSVLFLGHDASRSGAPLLLLELIKWLRDHSTIQPSVLLKNGGAIESNYRAIAPMQTLEEVCMRFNGGFRRRVWRRLQLKQRQEADLANIYPAEAYPLVYANTIATCDLALRLAGPRRRVVHHIHELHYTTAIFGATERLKQGIPNTDCYIAASHAVREYLEKDIGVPEAKIRVVHEFPVDSRNVDDKSETRDSIRKGLGIPNNSFVIGMCGLPQWRKGTDLFVQLAVQVARCFDPGQCHFVWLGGDTETQREGLHDVAQTGLKNICHFVAAVASPQAYFNAFDLFALTSREDPFSVAMLEAAASALPIVGFAGAGGAQELVENDAGVIVPYLDVMAMAKACVELILDPKRRRRLGEKARAKVQERYMLDIQGPKILSVIASLMG